jgi:predicted metalloprotease with PDZ domain
MIHTALPNVGRSHHWLEEGLATYVEPIVRARAGLVTPVDVWRDWLSGMPNGLPAPGDEGLDRTHTWGRTYWGGALFCLEADVAIRERTGNRRSLRDALRAIVARGGNISVDWSVERILDVGDAATGVTVLREKYERMATRPGGVDLTRLWLGLGVKDDRGTVDFDDAAPLAAIRRAMLTRQ